jgi:hypothetical protein
MECAYYLAARRTSKHDSVLTVAAHGMCLLPCRPPDRKSRLPFDRRGTWNVPTTLPSAGPQNTIAFGGSRHMECAYYLARPPDPKPDSVWMVAAHGMCLLPCRPPDLRTLFRFDGRGTWNVPTTLPPAGPEPPILIGRSRHMECAYYLAWPRGVAWPRFAFVENV